MGKLIVLDAGHGSNTYKETGGKGVPGLEEHSFNAAVVGYAKKLLEINGFNVLLTQPLNGRDVSLRLRTNLANAKKADLLMSFHADANGKKEARGHWGFYWHTSTASKKLADAWSEEICKATGTKHRGNQASKPGAWTNFHMVRESKMPAVLMEHAFMTNAEDLKLLQSDVFRKQCGEAAAKAVCRHFGVTFKADEDVKVAPAPAEEVKSEVIVAPKPAAKPTIIRKGDKGDTVRAVQSELKKHGHDIALDGIFGAGTEAAVIAFQKAHKLAADGIVGPATFAALAKAAPIKKAVVAAKPKYILPDGIFRLGANNHREKTKVIQRALNDVMKAGLTVDGVYGVKSAEAVRKFQAKHGLSADGIYGIKTKIKLAGVLK